MTKRRRTPLVEPGRSPFTAGSLMNLFAIPVVSGLIILSGFYYLTKDTLARHDQAIAADTAGREKLRDEFIANTRETAKGIASLAAHALVQDEQAKQMKDTLGAISTKLDDFSPRNAKR